MPTELQRQIEMRYGGTARNATPAEIHRNMHPIDYLSEAERNQIHEIYEATGAPLQVIVDYFAGTGRYCGERKKSFINAVSRMKAKHGDDVASHLVLTDIDELGHIKHIGNVLSRYHSAVRN